MRTLLAAALAGWLATPIHAQAQSMNFANPQKKMVTEEEVKAQQERDSAYKSAISKLPSQKPANDPWGNVRGAGATQNNQAGARSGAK
jgi:hypothetical protein